MNNDNVTEWQILFSLGSGKEDFYTENELEYEEYLEELKEDGELDLIDQCVRKDYIWNKETETWDEDWVEVLFDNINNTEALDENLDTDTTYIVCSYYDEKLHMLEDQLETTDWSEVENFAHEKLSQGNMVEIENTKTGKYKRLNPDEYMETFEGEFPIKPEVLEESIDTIEDDIITYKPVIKTYNETDYGWHNNATTLYGELLDGNWYSYVPDNESIEIYNAPITNKYIDTAYNYQTDNERADDEWFDKFQQEHNITSKYTQKEIFNLIDELDAKYFNRTNYKPVVEDKTKVSTIADKMAVKNYHNMLKKELLKVQREIENAGPGDISVLENKRDFIMDKLDNIELDNPRPIIEKSKQPAYRGKDLSDFKLMLKAFDNNGKHAQRGNWEIGRGGYDMWYEIYYNKVPVIRCINGNVEVEIEGYEDYAKLTAEQYGDTYIDTLTEGNVTTTSGRYDIKKYDEICDKVKKAYKDAWEGKISYRDLENIKKNSGLSKGELLAIQYSASRETDKKEENKSLSTLKTKLTNKVNKVLQKPEYGFDKDEIKDYIVVEVKKLNGAEIKVEVRAELDYEAFNKLIDELNPIIQAYDNNSYFDMEDTGIAVAYINNKSKKITESVEDLKVDIEEPFTGIDLSNIELNRLYDSIIETALHMTKNSYKPEPKDNIITIECLWDTCIGVYADKILKIFRDLGLYEKYNIDEYTLDIKFMEVFINNLIDYIGNNLTVKLIDTDIPSNLYVAESKSINNLRLKENKSNKTECDDEEYSDETNWAEEEASEADERFENRYMNGGNGATFTKRKTESKKTEEYDTFGIAEDMYNRTHKDKWHTLSDDEKASYYNRNYKRIKKQAYNLDKKVEAVNPEEVKEEVEQDKQETGIKGDIDTEEEAKTAVKKEVYQYAKQQGLDIEKLRKQGIELSEVAELLDKVVGNMVSKSIIEYEDKTGKSVTWDYDVTNNDIDIVITEL